jgi:DNA-binding winged helix-turn-helix (wHTH) protein
MMLTDSGEGRLTIAGRNGASRLDDRASALTWGAFRLDLREERLFKAGRELPLRTKPFSILRYLARRPRRLVPRDELVDAVWGKIAMSESLVRTHVWELRRVLGEDVVETVVGRGYRFVADVEVTVTSGRPAEHAIGVVGRTTELGLLRKAFQDVNIGRRSVALVSGEPGAGKSTLVGAFLEEASAHSPVWVARCRCLDLGAEAKPFQPLLEALGAMCSGALGSAALEVLSRHAPTLVAQMPAPLEGRWEGGSRRGLSGPIATNLLPELIEGLEALANERPLILVIDELQWADPSTIELVASLGRRREPSRLLVVATVRSSAFSQALQLTRMITELVARRRGVSIPLAGLDEQAVGDYLATRFGVNRFPAALASAVQAMTGGNPRFIKSLFDELEKDGLLGWDDEADPTARDEPAFPHGLVPDGDISRSRRIRQPARSAVFAKGELRQEGTEGRLVDDDDDERSLQFVSAAPRKAAMTSWAARAASNRPMLLGKT